MYVLAGCSKSLCSHPHTRVAAIVMGMDELHECYRRQERRKRSSEEQRGSFKDVPEGVRRARETLHTETQEERASLLTPATIE